MSRRNTKETKIDELIELLKQTPALPNVFNPWRDFDAENEAGPGGSLIRSEQLRHYLIERAERAKYLLIAEAAGYQGAHFTGIAMTSERILLGHKTRDGISPEDVFQTLKPRRTSRRDLLSAGFSEPTATVVWGSLLAFGVNSYEFILWNTFPWHPFNSKKGILSNRMPTNGELRLGQKPLRMLLDMFPLCHIISIGRLSHLTLTSLGIPSHKVRHPANGGAGQFRAAMKAFLNHEKLKTFFGGRQ